MRCPYVVSTISLLYVGECVQFDNSNVIMATLLITGLYQLLLEIVVHEECSQFGKLVNIDNASTST